jgi:prevent-host-death family protein
MFQFTTQNIKTITDMRERAAKLLDEVKSLGVVYVFQHSDPKAVMLSMEQYQRITELLEDHLDEMEAAKLSKEKRGRGIPLSKILAKFKKKSSV